LLPNLTDTISGIQIWAFGGDEEVSTFSKIGTSFPLRVSLHREPRFSGPEKKRSVLPPNVVVRKEENP
jgi:hypothetical protein